MNEFVEQTALILSALVPFAIMMTALLWAAVADGKENERIQSLVRQ